MRRILLVRHGSAYEAVNPMVCLFGLSFSYRMYLAVLTRGVVSVQVCV
jgi:hypothetical protein